MTGGSEVTAPPPPPPEEGSGSGSGGGGGVDHLKSLPASDPSVPLHNLSRLHRNLSSLRHFLSHALTHRHPLPDHHHHSISLHLSSAIHHTILNAAALLSSSHPDPTSPLLPPDPPADPKEEPEIVEIDAMELLADHVHFCEICGKGFKRDANLRMHMRAHGNKFKTLESLTSSTTTATSSSSSKAALRFSCPFAGCSRNKNHGRFRPMKSAVCVKNHYRRSHCPKTYSCTSCNKKSFSVLADLRSHQRSCGKCSRWRCSCGTSFSRKDKLFGHVSLFEGHLPVMEDEGKGVGLEDGEEEEGIGAGNGGGGGGDDELFDVLMDGFESVDRGFLDSVMGCPDDFCDL